MPINKPGANRAAQRHHQQMRVFFRLRREDRLRELCWRRLYRVSIVTFYAFVRSKDTAATPSAAVMRSARARKPPGDAFGLAGH